MALNFIPQVWAARLLLALEKSLVYASSKVTNRDYEGEIKNFGDSVRIGTIGDPTIGTYTKDTDISSPQALSDAEQTLVIDRADYFNIYVDSIDAAQQSVNSMEAAMRKSAYKLMDVVDQFIAANYVNVPSGNLVGSTGSPVACSSGGAYDHLVNLKVVLDVANVPTEERFAVIPPFMHGYLLKDSRFVAAGTGATDQRLANGLVGRAAGFDILMSNNVPTASSSYKVITGHPMAYTFADQIMDVKPYEPEKRFGNAVKGLHVYGGRLVRPTAWAVGSVSNL